MTYQVSTFSSLVTGQDRILFSVTLGCYMNNPFPVLPETWKIPIQVLERREKVAVLVWISMTPTEKPKNRAEQLASTSNFALSRWSSLSQPWTCQMGRKRASAGRIAPLWEHARISPSPTWGLPVPLIPPQCGLCKWVTLLALFMYSNFIGLMCLSESRKESSFFANFFDILQREWHKQVKKMNDTLKPVKIHFICAGLHQRASRFKLPTGSELMLSLRCWENLCRLWKPTGKPIRIMPMPVNRWSPYDRTLRLAINIQI